MNVSFEKIKPKKILKFMTTVVCTAAITLLIAFILLGGNITRAFEQTALIKKITTIDTKMNNSAICFDTDNDKVGDKLAQSYIDMLKDDDYSSYFSREDVKQRNKERKGIADKSIGVTIAVKPGEKYPRIVYVNRESPAENAGIKKYDILMKINGKSLENKTTAEAADYIKEKSEAVIILKRGKSILEKRVRLGEFTADSVIYRMIDKTCVIKITEFEESTVKQFDDAVSFAEKNNASSLIFDLRNNPGGYVDSCAKILDKICPEGELVKMKYKNGETITSFTSDNQEINLPIAVIINGNSASASEIFAMNIKDFKKGKLIGEKSFGKGIAQTTYELFDGTAVKFTTATIIDKNGETYHKKGLHPDIEVKFSKEQNENYLFLNDKQDTQLQKALETVKK